MKARGLSLSHPRPPASRNRLKREEDSCEFPPPPTATCAHTCVCSRPTLVQAARSHPPARLVTKHFLNPFAPSFCDILQQIKHPLLGVFSICFMLILIKESETEQTVPSRWPYKCEISKLFYLPQTLLVNFFKLIPASNSLLISRRKRSNPGLQIFASVAAPGANNGVSPLFHPHPLFSRPTSGLCWPNPSTQNKGHVPAPLSSVARTPIARPHAQERAPSPLSPEYHHLQPPLPLPTSPRSPTHRRSRRGAQGEAGFPPVAQPGRERHWGGDAHPGQGTALTLLKVEVSMGLPNPSLLNFFLLWDLKIPHVGLYF